MDEETLTADLLPMMIESLPTEEETGIISAWLKTNDDVDHLAKAEKFFVQIADLTNLTARLKAMQYKVTFADRVADLRPKLLKVASAIKVRLRSVGSAASSHAFFSRTAPTRGALQSSSRLCWRWATL